MDFILDRNSLMNDGTHMVLRISLRHSFREKEYFKNNQFFSEVVLPSYISPGCNHGYSPTTQHKPETRHPASTLATLPGAAANDQTTLTTATSTISTPADDRNAPTNSPPQTTTNGYYATEDWTTSLPTPYSSTKW